MVALLDLCCINGSSLLSPLIRLVVFFGSVVCIIVFLNPVGCIIWSGYLYLWTRCVVSLIRLFISVDIVGIMLDSGLLYSWNQLSYLIRVGNILGFGLVAFLDHAGCILGFCLLYFYIRSFVSLRVGVSLDQVGCMTGCDWSNTSIWLVISFDQVCCMITFICL